jgi:hypothetical protein
MGKPLHPALEALAPEDDYLAANPRSPYWTLAPHHIQQMTECSCSLATTVMLLNVLGVAVDETTLLDRLDDADWRERIGADSGRGLPLRCLPARWQAAMAAHGLAGWQAESVPVESPAAALPGLRRALVAAEAGEAWVAINFHLDRFYGDGADIGHWSPVAAYDAQRDRALVLDVYRKDYAPHWAPLPHLAEALAPRDPTTQEPRGYALLRRV